LDADTVSREKTAQARVAIENFLSKYLNVFDAKQLTGVRAVLLRLDGKTNAQLFKELRGEEARYLERHKGRGAKLVTAGLDLLRDHGIHIDLPA